MAPPSSPLVLSRPPRAPKAPSLSIHVEAVEKSGIPVGPSSCRSTHFLDGFNVDNCLDVHSIPDPPTPQPRKRRLSTPINLRSLEDVTNNPAAKQGSKRKDGDKKRKARNSLCHVPSPTVVQNGPIVPPLLPTASDNSHPNIGEESDTQQEVVGKPTAAAKSSICFDDDDDDNDDDVHRCHSNNESRRRKKRQSMVIPTELIIPPEQLDGAQSVVPKVTPPSSTSNKKKFEGSLQDMKNLQALVRGYCDLPEEERDSSEQARIILESTGYPLHNNLHRPSSPIGDKNQVNPNLRRSILRKIAPVIQDMDKRKVHDTKMLEDATGCRVEKGNRSGKYRYYSLKNNTKVPSVEYKDRYMAFIENSASRRAAHAEAWKEKLVEDQEEELEEEQDEVATSTDVESESNEQLNVESISTEENEIEIALSPLSASERSEAKGQDESPEVEVEAEEGALTAEETASEEEKNEDQQQQQDDDDNDKMDLCNMSSSLDMGDVDALPFDSEGGSESEEQTNEASEESMQDDEECCNQQNQEERLEDRNSQPLIALPSRDRGQSSDPEIARAEKKLWKRIDDALQDYSEEVLQILQRRKRQKTMKQQEK